jgi:hypothetical protein
MRDWFLVEEAGRIWYPRPRFTTTHSPLVEALLLPSGVRHGRELRIRRHDLRRERELHRRRRLHRRRAAPCFANEAVSICVPVKMMLTCGVYSSLIGRKLSGSTCKGVQEKSQLFH